MTLLQTSIFIIHLGFTLFMVGLIWFVQLVHYPLHALLGSAEHAHYQAEHLRRTGPVVAIPMIAELVTSVSLLWFPFETIPLRMSCLGLLLLGVIWGSTVLVQIPIHRRLERSADSGALRALVVHNWIRTVAWSARGALVLAIAGSLIIDSSPFD